MKKIYVFIFSATCLISFCANLVFSNNQNYYEIHSTPIKEKMISEKTIKELMNSEDCSIDESNLTGIFAKAESFVCIKPVLQNFVPSIPYLEYKGYWGRWVRNSNQIRKASFHIEKHNNMESSENPTISDYNDFEYSRSTITRMISNDYFLEYNIEVALTDQENSFLRNTIRTIEKFFEKYEQNNEIGNAKPTGFEKIAVVQFKFEDDIYKTYIFGMKKIEFLDIERYYYFYRDRSK